MQGIRVVTGVTKLANAPCSRCEAVGCPWDRIAEQPVCPDCQELLALGESEPMVIRSHAKPCAVCSHEGSVPFMTFPLHASDPLQIDLCPRHFHALIRRRLDRYAYRVLSRQLQSLGLNARQIFLLHEAFYDERGHPLQPVEGP